MRSAALQALRPLRSASRTIQSRCARQRPWLPSQTQHAVAISTTVRRVGSEQAVKATPSVSKPSTRRPSEMPTEPAIDPQAAIPPASVVGANPASTSASTIASSGPFLDAASGNGTADVNGDTIDWSSSFHGLATAPFSPETGAILMKPIDPADVEIKPDGIIYLPEIKYRRILNAAFGPGGWGLAPRGELVVGEKVVTREYALVVHGRFIAQARGECQYFSEETIPTAGEGCKSNALLRCCKDLGIASELWDPRFIREFKKTQCREVWVEHIATKKRRQIWVRKDGEVAYPYTATRK